MSSSSREVTIDSRTGYAGSFLRVRVDDVRLPSGRESVREVVEHPGAVAILATTADGFVLLVRQHRHAAGRDLLEIPAGTRDPGEPATETARRELIEETGFAPGRLTELFAFFPSPGYSAEQIVLFHADNCLPARAERDAEESASLVQVPIADVPGLLVGPEGIEDGKTLIGLQWLVNQGVNAVHR